MKFSNILPTSLISKYSGDFCMALANYIDLEKENEYEQEIKKTGLPIVLDNGAFETGTPDGVNNLLLKARRLDPAYVFAPDTLFNAAQTRIGFEAYEYKRIESFDHHRVAVVVQANNLEEYLEEFKYYNMDPRVSVIGLSYLAISHSLKYKTKHEIPVTKSAQKKHPFDVFKDPDYTKDRIEMLKKIMDLKLDRIKPVHMLGLGRSYEDILFAQKNCPFCRYNDTSTCYMAASKGLLLTEELAVPGGKIRDKINIEDRPSTVVENFLKINIKKVTLCTKSIPKQ